MSRADLGNYLGLVIETVSRVFTRMQRQRILAVDGRDIEILDPPRLHAVAGIDVPPLPPAGPA
jgi:CRP/FNR family transcriptional regulator